MHHIVLLLCLLMSAAVPAETLSEALAEQRASAAVAAPAATLPALTTDEARHAFVSAMRAYDAENFETAAELFDAVLRTESECARCAHLLGKSYGRLAERAGWTEAIGLAKKTRLALEQAVELAPNDAEAVRDLIRYYRAAPGFLGGSEEKARRLEQQLAGNGSDQTS